MKPDRLRKYYVLRFKRLKGDPRALAGGFAIGVFIGLTPTMPFHTIVILLATFATRTSAIAGILSSWLVCNPLTYIPIYYFSLVIGNAATPYHLNWEKIRTVLDILLSSESFTHSLDTVTGLGLEAAAVMITGGCLLALPFTLASYYLSLKFFIAMRKKRIQKHLLS